jgi:hypothetical protein
MDTARAVEGLYATGHWLLGSDRFRDAGAVFRALVTLSPADERGWLGLGAAHEGIAQPEIALEMYGTGRVVARPSPRCEVARARVLRTLGRDDEAESALDMADAIALEDDVKAAIASERCAP